MADISPAPSNPPQTGTKPVIVARGVRKHYGSIHAVDGVDLEVQEGELFGLSATTAPARARCSR